MKYFNKAQIDEIRNELTSLGVKDSELPDATEISGDELIAIVQHGINRKVGIKDFLLRFLPDDFLERLTMGESAYEIARKHGYNGSEAEWVESLKGANGANGADGKNGLDGISAGFGTPTANVTTNDSGQVGVTVSASGPNTAKVFSFTFTNLGSGSGNGNEGVTRLNQLTDVWATAPNTGDILVYNSSQVKPWYSTPFSSLASLTNGETYSSLSINGTTANFYTKAQTDGLVSATYRPAGSVALVSELGALTSGNVGKVYNFTEEFTTTSDFVEGSGETYPAGTNVAIVDTGSGYKYSILTGIVDLSGYQPLIDSQHKLNYNLLSNTPAIPNVFIAEYGITHYDDIHDAVFNYGSTVFCHVPGADGAVYRLGYFDDDNELFYFYDEHGDSYYTAKVNSVDDWDYESDTYGFENSSNKVTSLSSSSTDVQYPSAKCVYNAIAAAVSGITVGGSYLPITGGTINGNLRLQTGNDYYGTKINFGDGNLAYIAEEEDDILTVYGNKGLVIETDRGETSNQKSIEFITDYIQIGNAKIEYDYQTEKLHIFGLDGSGENVGFYCDGGVDGATGTGGGASYLRQLGDVYHTTSSVVRANGTAASDGDSLVYSSSKGKWVAKAITGGTGGTTYSAGTGISISNNTISLNAASTSNIGGIRVGSVLSSTPTINSISSTSGRYYYVQRDSNGTAFVNVPWTGGGSVSGYVGTTAVQSTSQAQALTGISSIKLSDAASLIKWENNAWHFSGNIYADGWIAAGGSGSSGTGGSSTLSGLTDVELYSITDGQVLVYRDGVWQNETITSSGTGGSGSGGGEINDAGSSTRPVYITGGSAVAISGLSVTGNIATTGGTLSVSGATTLSSTLSVSGATTLSSTLSVSGNSALSGTLTVGTAGVNKATTLNGTLSVSNAITLSGNTDAKRKICFGDSSHYIELKDMGSGSYAFHFSDGLYSDSWVSAGGVGTQNSGSGTVSVGTLDTSSTSSLETSYSESFANSISLHKIAKTGSYTDLQNKPTIPTVNNSTITIQMNGSTVDSFTTNASSAKTINLGTVLTSHQNIYALTLSAGTFSATSYNPKTSAKTVNIPTTLDHISDGTNRKLSDYVTLSGNENISGTKTFTSGLITIQTSSDTATTESPTLVLQRGTNADAWVDWKLKSTYFTGENTHLFITREYLGTDTNIVDILADSVSPVGTVSLGTSSARWSALYATSINLSNSLSLTSNSSYIDIGPIRLKFENEALHVTTNDSTNHPTIGLYADGFVSAGGSSN